MLDYQTAVKKLKRGDCDALLHEEADCVLMTYDAVSQQFKKGILLETGVIEYKKELFRMDEAAYRQVKWKPIEDARHLLNQKQRVYKELYELREMLAGAHYREFSEIYRLIEKMRKN